LDFCTVACNCLLPDKTPTSTTDNDYSTNLGAKADVSPFFCFVLLEENNIARARKEISLIVLALSSTIWLAMMVLLIGVKRIAEATDS
jgi:hypothetical protein